MDLCTRAKKGALRLVDYNLTTGGEKLISDFATEDLESARTLCDEHNEQRTHQYAVCMVVDEHGVAVYGLGQFWTKSAQPTQPEILHQAA